jgi:hypothetical protein
MCDDGFFGDDCSLKYCAKNCSIHGHCNNKKGMCDCDKGYYGETCNMKRCPGDCSGHG